MNTSDSDNSIKLGKLLKMFKCLFESLKANKPKKFFREKRVT